MNDSNWRTQASNNVLLERALMLKNIRAFFDAKSVIEVETPLLSRSATTDPHLDSLQSQFRDDVCYLNTSPEYAMKRLLASWRKPIYQICKAFRDDELGAYHNPEFTMLEWYRPDFDMRQLMEEVAELLGVLCRSLGRKNRDNTGLGNPEFDYISYQQAFEAFVGINPHQTSAKECYEAALLNHIDVPQGLAVEESELSNWLDWLLTQLVLPKFKKENFTFLYDYPVLQCSLAKIAENEQQVLVAKRFELFFGEIELANGFNELTDAGEQLQRFKLENKTRKSLGKEASRIDKQFIAALDHGLPECSGVALGLDRVLMLLSQSKDIKQVLSFSWVDS